MDNMDYFIKLAPRGFDYIENYFRDKREEDLKKQSFNATIVLATSASLGIFINIWSLILNSENSLNKVIGIFFIGIIIAVLSGFLVEYTFKLIFHKNKREFIQSRQ